MLKLHTSMISALTEASSALCDELPDTEASLAKIRKSASGCMPLSQVATLSQEILEEQGFVQIRGVPPNQAQPLFLALATMVGEPYIDPGIGSAIIPAHVRPGEHLMGNQLRRLPLHTDYSMLKSPPRLTMSLCIQPDAIQGFGAVYISDIESVCYGMETAPEIEELKNISLPFASRNAQDAIDVIDSPILTHGPTCGTLRVRYHRSRIHQGFQYRKLQPTTDQLSAMSIFEHLAESAIQVLHPEAGDITLIDNHRVVHGRERCSVELSAEGTVTGRQMMFLFAY